MRKVKFNKDDPKHIGNMGLHILGINDVSADKWLSYFTSDEMKKVALEDKDGFIARLPPHLREKATNLLNTGVGVEVNGVVDSVCIPESGVTNKTTLVPTNPHISSSVKETVVTDKGVLTSVESLRQKLSGIYSIQDFGKVWVEALTLAGLDADIEYVSNTGKKRVLSAMKAAIVSVVENTVDNI